MNRVWKPVRWLSGPETWVRRKSQYNGSPFGVSWRTNEHVSVNCVEFSVLVQHPEASICLLAVFVQRSTRGRADGLGWTRKDRRRRLVVWPRTLTIGKLIHRGIGNIFQWMAKKFRICSPLSEGPNILNLCVLDFLNTQ